MLITRVIPCLLLRNWGLVKTIKFKNARYVGDPVNVIRIFNEKEVDELILLDIAATPEGKGPAFEVLADVASECFMPLTFGGGIRSIKDIRTAFSLGVEKVALNSAAAENPELIKEAAALFGNQSIVVSLDVKKNFWGRYEVHIRGGAKRLKTDPVAWAQRAEELGAGEILLNSMDRDGTMEGYDLDLIKRVTAAVSVPVIACGGAGRIEHFSQAVKQGGASAVAAGSLVVFQGKERGVLINFPAPEELKGIFD